MALSYYSNWASFQQPEFASAAAIDDTELQSLFNPDDYLLDPYDSFCNSLLSDFTNGVAFDDLNSLATTQPPPFLPHQQEEYEPLFHFSKRQKLCDSQQFYPSLFDPCLAMLQDYQPPEFVIPPPPLMPEFPAADFNMGSCESVKIKEESGGGSLSAQSIAARQRRRRITVKTQELGKLVPGGQKMNTAEMLQSAYKYIKFLQAQVALLEFVGSRHQKVNEEAPFEGEEEFQNLLESPLVQEKLYSTEHCLVPQKLVEQHQVLKSSPHLLGKDHLF